MRLRRVYETAEEEGRPIEEVAIERFGNLQAFEEAREERAILDQRDQSRGRKNERTPAPSSSGHKSFSFSESASSSRSSSFRRPGGAPSTPSPSAGPSNRRLDSLRLQGGPGTVSPSPLSQSHTPIPSVMTPVRHLSSTAVAADGTPTTSKKRALSPSSLNKLQARVLRAKLMSSPDAEELEREYEEAARLSQGAITTDERGREVRTRVEVLPTLDGQGRMYDVGLGGKDEAADQRPGNRRKKAEKVRLIFRAHDVANIHSRWKLMPEMALSSASMPLTIRPPLARCFAKKNSAQECQIKSRWIWSMRSRSCRMGSLRMIWITLMIMRRSLGGRR